MGRIKHLADKIAQLAERDAERRAIATQITTLLVAPTLKQKKRAAERIEQHARRLAW